MPAVYATEAKGMMDLMKENNKKEICQRRKLLKDKVKWQRPFPIWEHDSVTTKNRDCYGL